MDDDCTYQQHDGFRCLLPKGHADACLVVHETPANDPEHDRLQWVGKFVAGIGYVAAILLIAWALTHALAL